jgi:hypothetical protein
MQDPPSQTDDGAPPHPGSRWLAREPRAPVIPWGSSSISVLLASRSGPIVGIQRRRRHGWKTASANGFCYRFCCQSY